MKQEFEKLVSEKIGTAITLEPDEYALVEQDYMNGRVPGTTSRVDQYEGAKGKQNFVKDWLKVGGVQWLLNQRQGRIDFLLEKLKEVRESEMVWVRDCNQALSERNHFRAVIEGIKGLIYE